MFLVTIQSHNKKRRGNACELFFSWLRESYTFIYMTLLYTYIYFHHYSFDHFDRLIFACFCELQYFCFWDCLSVWIFFSWNIFLDFALKIFSIYLNYYSLFIYVYLFIYFTCKWINMLHIFFYQICYSFSWEKHIRKMVKKMYKKPH